MFFLGVALSLLAQAQPVELPETVESWYTITQDGKACGYAQEKLERTVGPGAFSYYLRVQMDLKVEDANHPTGHAWHTEHLIVRASLEADLAVREFRANCDVNNRAYTLLKPITEGVQPLPSIMLFGLRQSGALSKPGTRRAALQPLRIDSTSAVDVAFEAGAPIQKEFLGKKGWILPIKFTQPGGGTRAETDLVDAAVDRYGRLVEATMRCGARMALVPGEKEAIDDAGILRRRDYDQRDPLERPKPGQKPGVVENPEKPVAAEALDSEISMARKDIEALRPLDDAARARDYPELLKRLRAMRVTAARCRPDLVPAIMALRRDLDGFWDGPGRAMVEARRLFVHAARSFERDDAEGLDRALGELRRFPNRPELEDRAEELLIVDRLVGEVQGLGSRLKTRRELARAKLDLTGTVVAFEESRERLAVTPVSFGHQAGAAHDLPFSRPRSQAILNGAAYHEGDAIEGTRIKVLRIQTHGVTVELDGEWRDLR